MTTQRPWAPGRSGLNSFWIGGNYSMLPGGVLSGSGSRYIDSVSLFDTQPTGRADLDADGDVDLDDFELFAACLGGAMAPPAGGCGAGVEADLDGDGDVDLADVAVFQVSYTGP